MKLVIDIEQESYYSLDNDTDSVKDLIGYVVDQIGRGMTSGYEPSWQIIEDTDKDDIFWLKFMRDQIRTGQHISETDYQRIVEALDSIDATRQRMLKERKNGS